MMKRQWGSMMLAGTLLVGGTGLAQNTAAERRQAAQEKRQQQSAQQPQGAQATGGAGQVVPEDKLATAKQLIGQDENAFLQRLHHANKTEIELGQLAQQKATDNNVKQYGQMMVTDHTKADQQLQAYAQKKGIQLSDDEPGAANDTERAVMDADKAAKAKLQAMQGLAFQYAYLTHMVGDHDMDISKAAAGMEQFKGNPELTRLLQQLSPVLTRHREKAYDLLGQHKARAFQARGSPRNR